MHLPLYFLLYMLLLMPVFLLDIFFPFVLSVKILYVLQGQILRSPSQYFFQITVSKLECLLLSGISLHLLPCGFILTRYYIDPWFLLLCCRLPEGRNCVEHNCVSFPYRVYQYLEHSRLLISLWWMNEEEEENSSGSSNSRISQISRQGTRSGTAQARQGTQNRSALWKQPISRVGFW